MVNAENHVFQIKLETQKENVSLDVKVNTKFLLVESVYASQDSRDIKENV